MEDHQAASSGVHRLAELMDADSSRTPLWQPGELAQILDHQLSSPIELDLGAPDAEASRLCRETGAAASPPIRSFRDLFGHPRPPLALLEATSPSP